VVTPNDANGGLFPGEVYPHPQDEFNCSILELNVPLATLQALKEKAVEALPVMVYIHGGGFVLGKIDQQHSMVPSLIVNTQGSNIIYSHQIHGGAKPPAKPTRHCS